MWFYLFCYKIFIRLPVISGMILRYSVTSFTLVSESCFSRIKKNPKKTKARFKRYISVTFLIQWAQRASAAGEQSFLAKSAEIQQGFVKINDREGKRLTSGLLHQHIKPLHSCWDFMWRLSSRMFLCATAIFSVYAMSDGANRLEKKKKLLIEFLSSSTQKLDCHVFPTRHIIPTFKHPVVREDTFQIHRNSSQESECLRDDWLFIFHTTVYTAGKQVLPSQPFRVLCSSALQIIILVQE